MASDASSTSFSNISAPNTHAAAAAAAGVFMRPLVLSVGFVRVSIPVAAQPSEAWVAADVLREQFVYEVSRNPSEFNIVDAEEAIGEESADVDALAGQAELVAKFLDFIARQVVADAASGANATSRKPTVLLSVFQHFHRAFLASSAQNATDVQTFASKHLDVAARKHVLKGYYAALDALNSVVAKDMVGFDDADVPKTPMSKLFQEQSKGSTEIYALFGGQGSNEVYFDELQTLYDTYKPFVNEFLTKATYEVLVPHAEKAQQNGFSSFYTYGLDALGWLSGAVPRPPVSYLASIPLSLPLIGLTQLTQYLVAVRALGFANPGSFRDAINGVTGHSQGVVSAVVLSTSNSMDDFLLNAMKGVELLFYIGLRGQEAFPTTSIEPSIVSDAVEGGEGVPTPMLSVTGLFEPALQKHIDATNKHLPGDSQIAIRLFNGPRNLIVTGPPKALFGLVSSLRSVRAPSDLDQSKTPFSKRKPVFNMRFLPVGVPYHSDYLLGATQKVVEQDLGGKELWTVEQLQITVYKTDDGSDLRQSLNSLTASLCDQIFTSPIHWKAATDYPPTATHAIDFGPGGLSGIGGLTARNLEGRGVRTLIPSGLHVNSYELYDANEVKREDNWTDAWSPALVKTKDGRIRIDTPFARLLGKAPIMVAGMTPSTVQAGFNAAVLNAGYHIELAGGGHYNAKALRAKVADIESKIQPGQGLTLNALYINQRQWGFQFPEWIQMRKEGLPIEGFCVAAGIPSAEKATEVISALREAGIKHVSFKPGSVDGIRQVVNIAATNSDFPIILQWTGGRAGGHHSCEDFHQPILSTYASIRSQKNISLVAGSGFGGADDFWPYLTGDWATQYGVQRMPFDGLLFASRVMVAKEAHTSPSVKQLIVAASGVNDDKWEGTYQRETGGILTVRSELGEPIHKIATRGVKLWREFDDTIFALPREKRAAWLEEKKDYVISRLNKDFQKPWFPAKADGSVAGDVSEMTYEEVTTRMLRLLYVSHQSRWIDVSLRNLVGDWLRRVEERFACINSYVTKASKIQSYSILDAEPAKFIDDFFAEYAEAKEQLLASEDKAYFLAIAQRPGQKPVPFIPVLDAGFEVWFKKDSLWQAEDMDAVFDQDPQRVCILQGPVAVKHSKVADEPIKDMLGNVESALVDKLLQRYYGGDASKVPMEDYLIRKVKAVCADSLVTKYDVRVSTENACDGAKVVRYALGDRLPPRDAWLQLLSGKSVSWLRALLTTVNVVQGDSYVNNPLARLFSPRRGQTVEVVTDAHDEPVSIALSGAARSAGQHAADFKAVEVTYDCAKAEITLVMNEERRGEAVPLKLVFTYRPDMAYAPIHEAYEDRNDRVKQFYWQLWFGEKTMPELELHDTFKSPEVTIDAAAVETFCCVVGNQGESFKRGKGAEMQAPMDFAIVTGWQSIMKAIFPKAIDGDILKLVHLSNGFRMVDGASPLKVGDKCTAEARVASVVNGETGKTVKVKGFVLRDGKPVIEVTSAFFFRGRFDDDGNAFETIDESDYKLTFKTKTDVAVLTSKEWFEWEAPDRKLVPGTTLIFKTRSNVKYKNKTTFSAVTVEGAAYVLNYKKELVRVGAVDFESSGDMLGNPVVEYLKRQGQVTNEQIMLENGGYTLTSDASPSNFLAPISNEPYSKTSGDFNPIHVNPYFSDYALLPGTITHGLYSSAATRRFVETVVAENRPERVLSYQVTFVGMVLPTDELKVKLTHVAMRRGNKVVKVETFNQNGEKVLEGTAEVAQPPTVYVFTGQGSQEPNMGMELYNSSATAKAIWDTADAHLDEVYGFSIIDIVKNNPMEKTIHFGGLKGQAIRERYMNMTYDTMDEHGNVKTLPLFPEIDLRTHEFTFNSPNGLLYATQFAQIALVVTEKAAFEDMRDKGLIQEGSAFAGHSLGEYAALASIADVMPISALCDVVFFRGLTMQRAVQRDEQGRSSYGMMACNPSRIGNGFNDAALKEVVDTISRTTNKLLEIVNYNVAGQQLVIAGELLTLLTLSNTLNFLKIQKIDLNKLAEIMSVEDAREKLSEIVGSIYAAALEEQAKGTIVLQRGFATIPLPGIDVPFHSRFLWGGVHPFRQYLSRKIDATQIDPAALEGKYIPNLTAEPYMVTKDYAERIIAQTSSPRLERILKNWDRDGWGTPEMRQRLAYNLLIELLAYQFASPVRWIETQDRLFGEYKFERLIELGPSPTLAGMANRTFKLKYEAMDASVTRRRTILCHAKNAKDIYYQFEDEAPSAEEAPAENASAPAPAAAPAPVAAAPVPVAASAGPAAEVPDEPLKAVDTLRVIIAQKLKKAVSDVPLSKTIKDLVGGKSTMQNEILGDLQLEFTSAPEKGEELPLDELGAALNVGYAGTLGKHTGGLVSRLIGAKMPGGFNLSSVKGHLSKAWGLGPGRSEGVLLLALTMDPPKRLGSEAEAKAWLDSVVAAYGQQAGLSLSQGGGGAGAAGGAGAGPMINSEEFEKFQAKQDELANQHVELYMRYLGADTRAGHKLYDEARKEVQVLQDKLDQINKEHGEKYINGIAGVFEPVKARHFKSSWNWVRQDALILYHDILFGRLRTVDRKITQRCIQIMNRASPELLTYMQVYIHRTDVSKGETYQLAKTFGQALIDNVKEALSEAAVYKDVTFPTAPKTEVDASGRIVYREVNREGVRKLEQYVKEMAAGSKVQHQSVNLEKVQDDVSKLWRLVKAQPQISRGHKAAIKSLYGEVVRSLGRPAPDTRRLANRTRRSSSQFLRPQSVDVAPIAEDKLPLLHLKRKVGSNWQYSSKLTQMYLDVLHEIATTGTTFKNKNALLTGVGKGSIGVEILKGLLSGGARCVITTSRYSRATVEYYQTVYQEFGSEGSTLTVVPFNQGSKQDVEALVDYIYDPAKGMGLDLDYVLPFAALPENGREIDGLDDTSELSHRIMLVNLLRILGAIKTKKAARHFVTRPTQVVLPLSPNHGLFGNDGLYSESKISLETLFNRWASESWGEYLCLAGAVIGWTRGTGLMSATNMVAEGVEKFGVRTFSAKEMAFNILGLMHPLLFDVTQIEPIWADLNGGMDRLPDLSDITTRLRLELNESADARRAISIDNSADFKVVNGADAERLHAKVNIKPRANFKFEYPPIKSAAELKEYATGAKLDLDKVVVVTGFAEVGPWGSTRTRWEMEARGEFSIEGCIEMAWMMGLIKHVDGRLKSGKTHVGWVDAKSEEPLDDKDVKVKYEKQILDHAGIRLIEPELFKGYDPKKKQFNQEIELNHDLEPLEVSAEEAAKFKHEHGDKVDTWEVAATGQWFVKFRKGARVFVPKAISFDRLVAGQIPTGWNAARYGIPQDIVDQVDRTTLWALVCVSEALIMSGINDPYELYKYIHPSQLGTALGSGMGGVQALGAMFKDRREEKPVQMDILQETFINTVAGWVNLLLLSSSGPIKIPVGACATALQSLDIACDTLRSGKAKVMIAGGFDDFSEEGSYEFANMKATSNAETEFAAGREPSEFSRPTTSTRAGFLESQGAGVQVLMTASTAIELGAPIFGIIGYTSTHTDKQGRSVPAPGHGVLASATNLRNAVAEWGLTADHIGLVSFHGTSTKANDKNESHIYSGLLKKIGRTPGFAVPVAAQKWLTGHTKGGAAAFMFNGTLQAVNHAIVPGNRNADDISPELRQYNLLFYPSRTIKVDSMRAALVTSFGFGQVGGIALILHPDHLLAMLDGSTFDEYRQRRAERYKTTYKSMHSALVNGDLVRVKDAPPYPEHLEDEVLLNPNARATFDGKSYSFRSVPPVEPTPASTTAAKATLANAITSSMAAVEGGAGTGIGAGVGVDIEDIAQFPSDNETFLQRNFTAEEQEYCRSAPDSRASFAGKFAAKEAVFKSLSTTSRGGAAAMIDIVIESTSTGPKVRLEGRAKEVAEAQGITQVQVSISHDAGLAVAVARSFSN